MATATVTSDITITEKAKDKLLALMAEAGLDDSHALRVSVQGGGCSGLSYKLDLTILSNQEIRFSKTRVFACL